MSTTTPNLGLVKWNLSTDKFSSTQYNANLDLIDAKADTIRRIEILAALPTSDLFQGRMCMLNVAVSGFPAWTLVRWDGVQWEAVGPVEVQASPPVTSNFVGRLVLLSAATASFTAWTLIRYDGAGWAAVNANLGIKKANVLVGTRPTLNFTDSSNALAAVTDDAANNKVDVTYAVAPSITARAERSAVLSIPDSTPTAITWSATAYDVSVFWSGGSPTRLTVPTNLGGSYLLSTYASYVSNATGIRGLEIRKNGGAILENYRVALTGRTTPIILTTWMTLVPTDYLEVFAYQSSGAPLNIEAAGVRIPFFSLHKVGF